MKKIFIFCLFASFLLYHDNSGLGPDSSVYRSVAKSIVDTGSLNILPDTLDGRGIIQITSTNHAPIHQNIGGVIFILPATILSLVSVRIAELIPSLPPLFYDANYHEQLWLGGISYVLALLSCFLMYKVASLYHKKSSVVTTLIASFYGGPLFIYLSAFPCNMNLPVAFLASLLLFTYHFGVKQDDRTWLLLGAIWSIGVFTRSEFALWGLLLAFGIYMEYKSGQPPRKVLRLAVMAGTGCLFFLPAAVLIREIIYGTQGNTYAVQFDYRNLFEFPQFLFGWHNGLFSFWPLLLIATFGYLARWSRNPPIYHVLFLIMILALIVFSTTLFWSGELGVSFGQRRILLIMPIFILYLARLLDLADKKIRWVQSIIFLSVCWALMMFVVYGQFWRFSDGTCGLLMANDIQHIITALNHYSSEIIKKALAMVLLPKHADVIFLLPLFTLIFYISLLAFRHLSIKRLLQIMPRILIATSIATTLFLLGAGRRGEQVFINFAAANPEVSFERRNYEIDNEMLGSFVDSVSYYLEQNRDDLARHFREKGERFFAIEAPDSLPVFDRICDALILRRQLGWYRLVPEQSHIAVYQWYDEAMTALSNGQSPPETIKDYRY